MSNSRKEQAAAAAKTAEDDDAADEWDQRIFSTGCADENSRLNGCFREKKDWRGCVDEMEAFKQCWKRRGNEQRTESKDCEGEDVV